MLLGTGYKKDDVKGKGFFFYWKGILILDLIKIHVDENVKMVTKNIRADLAVILEGLIKKLQPLDISLNHSFKSKIR